MKKNTIIIEEQDEQGYRTEGRRVSFPMGKSNRNTAIPFYNHSLRERWNMRFQDRNNAGFYWNNFSTTRQDEIKKELDFIN